MKNKNQKLVIGKIMLKCLSQCNDIIAIYNLSNEHEIITHRNSLPIIPDIELLVITQSLDSAEQLFNNQKGIDLLSDLNEHLSQNLVNTKFLSIKEFTDLHKGKKSLLLLRIKKSTLIYTENLKEFNNLLFAY